MQTTNERISIDVNGTEMGAYVAKPAGDGAWPAVLLFMEVFGINAHIRSVVDRVAAEGYVVLSPDLFHRTGPGVELAYDEEGLMAGVGLMGQVTAAEALADVGAAIATLEARDDVAGKAIGAMGFCFGGHIAYLSACEFPIAATASFYGGGVAQGVPGNEGKSTVERSDQIKGRILCLFGEKDDYIPAADVEKIRTTLAGTDVGHELVVYPGVGHGFFCDIRPDYDEKSAADAWSKVKALFASELTA
jgi:carboxymethylenebutenolidase